VLRGKNRRRAAKTRPQWTGGLRGWHLLVALGLVAAIALASRWKAVPAAGGPVLATVDDISVTSLDVAAEAQSKGLPASHIDAATRKALLGQVIDRKLLAAVARKRGLEADPLFKASMDRAAEMVAAGATVQQLVGQAQPAGLGDARRYMAANPMRFGARQVWTVDGVVGDVRGVPAALTNNLNSLGDVVAALVRLRIPYERVEWQLDTATLPKDVAYKLGRLGAGKLFRMPSGDKSMIGLVTARALKILPAAQQLTIAREAAGQARRETDLAAALETLRDRAVVRYATGVTR
jgi:peptidyl-prolyl cis-trans isomerase C